MAAAAFASLAAGQMSFTSQTRFVTATASSLGTPSSESASDFGPFNGYVFSQGPHSAAEARQGSELGSMLITVFGEANPGATYLGGAGSARSSCLIVFTAVRTQTFLLQGSFKYGSVSLVGPGVNINKNSATLLDVNQSGTFQSGASYTFQVETTGASPLIWGQANITLAIVSAPTGNAFAYQGVARKDGANINGPTDFQFSLYSLAEGGVQVGQTIGADNVAVNNGVFTHQLVFGPVFDGNSKWLEVRMRAPAGSGSFTTISPRTPINPTPYAESVPWAGVTDVPANVSGAFSPWQAVSGGLDYQGGLVSVGNVLRELNLNSASGLKIGSGGTLAFGTVGDTLGTAENSDFIAFRRINPVTSGANQSELRLYLGDDPTTASNSQDYFTIGSIPGGTWTPTFGFRSDGLASKPGGGSWANLSDPRAKHDIRRLTGTLDRLLALRGYEYFYNDDVVRNGKALAGPQIGLMADEVERVFPDWIFTDRDGMRMVSERATTALMVEALRDLRREKDQVAIEARREIEGLRKQNAALEERLRKLEDKLNR